MWRNADVLDFVRVAARLQRRAASGRAQDRLLRPRPLLALTLDRGGDRLSRQGRSRGRRARPRPLRLLRLISATTPRSTVRRRSGSPRSARTKPWGSWSSCSGAPPSYAGRDGRSAADEQFFAEQNARLARNAEAYYRAMFRGRVSSWNLRDRHMADTLDALVAHLRQQDGHARIVVWAHNSHLGDARATEMGDEGELNLGQLVRERHPAETYGRFHHLRGHRDGRRRLGRTSARGGVSVPALPGRTKTYCIRRPQSRRLTSCSICGTRARQPKSSSNRAWSGRSASSTSQKRAIQSLLPRHPAQAVRYRAAHRPHVCRAAHRRRPGFEAPDETPETWPFGV